MPRRFGNATFSTATATACSFAIGGGGECSPIRRRHHAIAKDHGLAGEALGGVRLEPRGRGEVLASFHDLDAATVADADAAAGVSDGGAGAAGDIEDRFVCPCLGRVSYR